MLGPIPTAGDLGNAGPGNNILARLKHTQQINVFQKLHASIKGNVMESV